MAIAKPYATSYLSANGDVPVTICEKIASALPNVLDSNLDFKKKVKDLDKN